MLGADEEGRYNQNCIGSWVGGSGLIDRWMGWKGGYGLEYGGGCNGRGYYSEGD